jgi:hypothetical protein
MSATADAYDHQEEASPIAFGSKRCSACGQIKPLEGDGMCSPCLNYKAVPVKAHVPRPRYRVTVRDESGAVVFGPEDFVTERAVDHTREMWDCAGYSWKVEYLNSKAGVLR